MFSANSSAASRSSANNDKTAFNDMPGYSMISPSFISNSNSNNNNSSGSNSDLPMLDTSMLFGSAFGPGAVDAPLSAPLSFHGFSSGSAGSPSLPGFIDSSAFDYASSSSTMISPSVISGYSGHHHQQNHQYQESVPADPRRISKRRRKSTSAAAQQHHVHPLTPAQMRALESVQHHQQHSLKYHNDANSQATPLRIAPAPPQSSSSEQMLDNLYNSSDMLASISASFNIDPSQMTQDQLRQLATELKPINNETATEIRRQIHIHNEQKRRAEIKGGFDELRMEMPDCVDKKRMSKTAVLAKAVEFVRDLKAERDFLAEELRRLQLMFQQHQQ